MPIVPSPADLFTDPAELHRITQSADPRDPVMRQRLFWSALALRGVTYTNACRYLGVSQNHLRLVLAGERKGSARLEAAIAGIMGESRLGLPP